MFVDQASIVVKAGDGGRGCRSFKKLGPKKKIPNGGDGGRGGDVILEADQNKHSLLDFSYRKNFKATSGRSGSSNNKTGKSGKDLIIKVPCGTLVRDENDSEVIADLVHHGQRAIVAKGGRGGRGNNNAPWAEEGQKGEERHILLELKFLADVGIVGLPNSGKSTLINALCGTHSRIGIYPFTTKIPILGVLRSGATRMVFADIPGIIKDAHKGRGLGLLFLRHIERTKIMVFLLDASPMQSLSLDEQFEVLKGELKNYNWQLLKKPYIIAVNKIDLEESRGRLKEFSKRRRKNVVFISALKRINLDRLVKMILKRQRNEKGSSKDR